MQPAAALSPHLLVTSAASTARLVAGVAACLFGLLAFKGLEAGGIVLTDAARHAMNGALIHDWLAEGPWLSPGAYARWYYAHWPSLSLGYHPPVFPAFEAGVFLALGVSPFASRFAVAVATVACAWLFYRLVLRTHGSPLVALTSMIAAFSLPLTRGMSQDVMLEMPALVFVLLALLTLPPPNERFTARTAALFAMYAGLAVWTKQLAVFVGAVPLGVAALNGPRQSWRSPAVWAASLGCAAAFGGLSLFELAFGAVSPRRMAALTDLQRVLGANSAVYFASLEKQLGLVAGLGIAAVAMGWALYRRHWRPLIAADGLYLVWAAAALVAVLVGEWQSTRYLFFVYPPLLVLAMAAAYRLITDLTARPSMAAVAPSVVALALATNAVVDSPRVLRGPSDAAALVAADRPVRVVYAGESDGHFSFALRAMSGRTDVVVIRGERLPASDFAAEAFETFATRYGVSHVVLEEVDRFLTLPWTALIDNPAPSMRAVRQVPVRGMRQGTLHVYRFLSPSPHPENVLDLAADVGDERARRLDWSTPPWRRGSEGRP